MKPRAFLLAAVLFLSLHIGALAAALPADVVFKGRDKFVRLIQRAEAENWRELPIGERTAAVGRALVGTPYKSFTLEIHDRIESPSVNLDGLDCWTFFECALAFARMLNEPRENWTPEIMLRYIELDRYRGGNCTGDYLSRLHYLEEWLVDNHRRGLVRDLSRSLGGVRVGHTAREMTVHWRSYRYLRSNPALLAPLRQMEDQVTRLPFYHVPKNKVASMESELRNGDIIGITSYDGGGLYSTAHVGLAYRDARGVLRFMHASSPRNYGRVVVDDRLSTYLKKFRSNAGIIIGRPVGSVGLAVAAGENDQATNESGKPSEVAANPPSSSTVILSAAKDL